MKKIIIIEKILHWLVLLSFLGLCTTALAAEYFFSKEAIMDSFKESLPMLNLEIAPVDRFFISRIARRDTWDIHLYFGFSFAFFTIIWIIINISKRNTNYLLFKTFFFTSSTILVFTGIYMWLRLYIEVSEETFSLLKRVHYYAYWIFIFILIIHIFYVIYIENTKKLKRKGALSNMINFKTIMLVTITNITLFQSSLIAKENNLNRWLKDNNYIEGVLYIEGKKGYDVLLKEVSNCPYDKCKLEDVEQTKFGTKQIEIKKPDYKKAINLLSKSSEGGNPLAAEKLLKFLTKRINYKSKKPNGYLLKLLKDETSLNFIQYKRLISKTLNEGLKTNKSCFSEYLFAEIHEKGILGYKKELNTSIEYYNRASKICPTNNLFKIIASGKLISLKN